MVLVKFYKSLSLTKKIYISTVLGFIFGLFFGDDCRILSALNTMFILVFQTAIIPFMIFSIIYSIGSLTDENAKRVGKKGGIVLICLWGISIIFTFLLQFSFPDILTSSFFEPRTSSSESISNFYNMFIPYNPFYSLANGKIPAIVVFCILVGMALIREKRKSGIVTYAEICSSLMNGVNNFIMHLLPFGVLVMATYTFGTLSFAQLKGVLLYIIASLLFLLFMSFIIYPIILTSISALTFRRFFEMTMPVALVAFSTGSVFLALPIIYSQMYKFNDEENGFLETGDAENEKGHNLISILVPLAWVVPASYKFLVIFFLIFEEWFYNLTVNYTDQIIYFILGIPCLFGSNSVIVPFMLQAVGLPDKTYDIFMMVSSFLVYFNNANGAVFIVVASTICYYSLCRKIKINYVRLFTLLALSTITYIVIIIGLNAFMLKLLSGDDELKKELENMDIIMGGRDNDILSRLKTEYIPLDKYIKYEFADTDETALQKISRTGVIQVGYDPGAAPFSFFNKTKKLVGYDIAFIYDLATNLGCEKIEFYPITNINEYHLLLKKDVNIDICVGGFNYMSKELDGIVRSFPYMKCTPSVVIPVSLVNKYPDFESVLKSKELTIGFRDTRSRRGLSFLTGTPFVPLETLEDYYVKKKTDALLIPGEMASALGIIYPGYWVYYYYGYDLNIYFAYLMSSSEKYATFREAVNGWIYTCQWDNIARKRYDYWISGKISDDLAVKPWSVLGYLKEKGFFLGFFKKEEEKVLSIPKGY